MIRLPLFVLVLSFVFVSACADVGDAPEAETTTVELIEPGMEHIFSGTALRLTPENSSIAWTAAKITRRHEGGFSAFSGSLYVDDDTVTGVELSIEAASIFTDPARLTEHLKSDDFFEVETWPEARFEATSFEPLADGGTGTGTSYSVTGSLTMRDRMNQIVFPAEITVSTDSVWVSSDFIINRQLWGLTYPGQPDDLVQDEVRIKLWVNAVRASENGPEL